MAQYSLFVLKVPLNPKQTNKPVFAGWMPFLSPNRQCRSSEGKLKEQLFQCHSA